LAAAAAIAIDCSDLLLANHSRYFPYALGPSAKRKSHIAIFDRNVRQEVDLSLDTLLARNISQRRITGNQVWMENRSIDASENCEEDVFTSAKPIARSMKEQYLSWHQALGWRHRH
jgi:hypothetical protein